MSRNIRDVGFAMNTGRNENSTKQKMQQTPKNEKQNQASFAKLAEPYEGAKKVGVITKLRNYFLTGLIVVGPLFITFYALWTFVTWVDELVKPYLPELPPILQSYNPLKYIPFTLPEIPGIGLVFAIFALMVVGALMANLFGQTILSYGETMLGRMPIVRNVYSALKQIFETVLSQSNNSFQKVGLIEYPRKGIYSIVFVSKETAGEIAEKRAEEGGKLYSVFLPTTPNPTSGFLLFVPHEDVRILDMSVEEGAKMVISAGLIEPGVNGTENGNGNGVGTSQKAEKVEFNDPLDTTQNRVATPNGYTSNNISH